MERYCGRPHSLARLVTVRASEWKERLWMLKADLSGAFGSMRYPDL